MSQDDAAGEDITCRRCGKEDEDFRTLMMRCGYKLSELNVHWDNVQDGDRGDLYKTRICKRCRGQFMEALQKFWNNVVPKQAVNSGIFVREFGATVEISREEWDRRNPRREPAVWLGED